MIWVVYFSIILFYLILRSFRDDKAKRCYIIIVTLILCVLSALRHPAVGNDTYSYMIDFYNVNEYSYAKYFEDLIESIGQTTSNENKDIGYNIISKFCYQYCCGNFMVYQFFVAALLLVPLGLIIKRYVINFSGYIIAYFFYVSLFYSWLPNSATRQTIAVAFYLWAFLIWTKRHWRLLAILLFLIATTIHKSVLINVLPMVLMFVNNKRLSPKYAIIGGCIMAVAGNILMLRFADIAMSDNYAKFVMSNYYENEAKPYVFIFQMICFFVIALKGGIYINIMDRYYKYIYINFLFAIIFTPTILVDPSFVRLTAYFSIWGCIFIPNIVNSYHVKKRSIVYIILIALVIGRPILRGSHEYKFFWQYMKLHDRYGWVIPDNTNRIIESSIQYA